MYKDLITYNHYLFQYISHFVFFSLIISILYIDYISDEDIKINKQTLKNKKFSLSYFILIINILLLIFNSINIIIINYTSLVVNLSLERNACWILNPEDNNSENRILKIEDNNANKKDYTKNYYHNGKDTSFELNFELRKLSKKNAYTLF